MKLDVIEYLEHWFKSVEIANMLCKATYGKSIFEWMKEEMEKIKEE